MNRPLVIATLITLAATGWVLSGQIGARSPAAAGTAAGAGVSEAAAPAPAAAQSVRVKRLSARPMTAEVTINGRTEASRAVELRTEVRGRVAEILVERGAVVTEGQPLVRLAVDDRRAILDQARALVAQRRIEHEAALTLNRRGHAADVQLAAARAMLEAAEAQARHAEVDLGNLELRAPFGGVLDQRPVELGHFMELGKPVATVLDLDPLRVVGFATERHVGTLRVNGTGFASVVGEPEVQGRITYIAAMADATTRTFRVELEIPNPGQRVVAGLTARLRLPVAERTAHLVAQSALSLADDGRIGVKIVDDGDIVRFHDVELLGTATDGVWLGGLPDTIRLITVGHEYVADGNRVAPVEADPQTGKPS